jgi:agmatine deiminase
MKMIFGPEDTTPADCGFFMPAEWEVQEGIWLSWPHDEETFPDLKEVKKAYTAIIRTVCEHEKVHLLVNDEDDVREVTLLLSGSRGSIPLNLELHTLDYTDVWIRDYGPSFVVNREKGMVAMIDWKFNAWGNKYPSLLHDDNIPTLMNKELNLIVFSPGIVLEGGSIEVNGKGAVMTTEQCLLNRNRNPEYPKEDIERLLSEYLGCNHFLWLKDGIAGDDTDGHIDDIARFVNDRTIVCSVEDDRDDENFRPLMENFSILSRETDQAGVPLRVIPLPMPGRIGDDHRLPASYANFLITNRSVLFPTFDHPNDRKAHAILASVFPGRKLVGIDCRALVNGLGAIHCITQQQPLP